MSVLLFCIQANIVAFSSVWDSTGECRLRWGPDNPRLGICIARDAACWVTFGSSSRDDVYSAAYLPSHNHRVGLLQQRSSTVGFEQGDDSSVLRQSCQKYSSTSCESSFFFDAAIAVPSDSCLAPGQGSERREGKDSDGRTGEVCRRQDARGCIPCQEV